MSQTRECNLIAVYGRQSLGKTTVTVSLALEQALECGLHIRTNLPLTNLPEGLTCELIHEGEDLLASHDCVLLCDQLNDIFPSDTRYLKVERDQKLFELAENVGKQNVYSMVFNAQWRHSVRNLVRNNCKYVVEPTKTLSDGKPEYMLWDDVNEYEKDRNSGNYNYAELMHVDFTLAYLQTVFDTRNRIHVQWSK